MMPMINGGSAPRSPMSNNVRSPKMVAALYGRKYGTSRMSCLHAFGFFCAGFTALTVCAAALNPVRSLLGHVVEWFQCRHFHQEFVEIAIQHLVTLLLRIPLHAKGLDVAAFRLLDRSEIHG